ncbi:TIR domain-containing protein [Alkalicaulis satelles]|uniref:TIR domain-containing protein n=1 Tax=Alkalicaulis satelles TaxID=2609175 RepID=A0A5M6ZKI0_9PROT|nr:TIR domain-containing protein [Alkalicaulis satelles]KAA5805336.1 TIR domain-containing protein [Alkalicaulis satelles]
MKSIFISHATADKRLAEIFTEFLKEGIGVPANEIFCSSVDGHGILTGSDFNQYIKDQIGEPKLVIMLITQVYVERAFCLMELGAAWVKSHKVFPIIIPPVGFDFVTKTLGLVQAQSIDDHAKLHDLRASLREATIVEARTEQDWDKKRIEWQQKLARTLKKLPKSDKVTRDEYDELKKEIEALDSENDRLRNEVNKQADLIEALKASKDSDAVTEVLARHSDEDQKAEFHRLLSAVKDARPPSLSKAVFQHIILDHYDKAPSINLFRTDADDYREAMSRNVIDPQSHAVNWQPHKMQALKRALEAFDWFMESSETKGFREDMAEEHPMDAPDLDFWEYHL